jgi:para-nitrobenzyl esterase
MRAFILFFYLFANTVLSNPSFFVDETEIIGFKNDKNVNVYLGIPYAEPPINELRWHKTLKKEFKQDKFYANKFGSACMQGPRIVNWYRGVAEGFGGDPDYIDKPNISEDCLYLNIWAPEDNINKQDIPVLLYIHGGANRAGWAFEPNYIGENLASKGVIVVTVSYRLGIFGFYTHPELDISNFALLDLIESLKWIKTHISKLGGDPNNITISGESAGATNVAHLIVSPLSKNLFNKAIHQSAGWSIAEKNMDHDIPLKLSNQLSDELVGSANNINELRKISSKKLLKTAEKIYGFHGYYSVVDNYSIFEPIYKSFENGNFHHVDLIIGTNADEELMYLDNDYYLSNFYEERQSWGFYKDIEEINLLIDDIKDDRQKINYLLTARNWTCPSSYIAKSINDHTNKNVWFYSFDRVRDGLKSKEMGAYHGAELPYVFNTHDEWLPTSNKDLYITKIMQSYWINFLRDGNPDPNNNSWKSFEANKFNVLSFNDKISMQTSNSVDVCEALGY